MRFLIFGLAVAAIGLGAAEAQPAPDGGGPREACRPDAAKFCSDVQQEQGHGHVFACLRQHQDQLSDGCKSAMANAHHHWRQDPSSPGPQG